MDRAAHKKMTWTHTTVSEKTELTDGQTDGRTTNACATTVALVTKSSRAKNLMESAKL